ncbi:MAG: pentapeptide repeat-containing protein, partial [Ghiorsea sp.]
EGSQSPAHDAKALTSCAMLVAQASSQHAFQRDQLNVWQKKNYARQLNALIRTLLCRTHESIAGLCFDGLKLQNCKMNEVLLPYASFRMSDLSQSVLTHADLHGGDLRNLNATGSNMSHIDLHDSWLDEAHLSWIDLSHADLRHIQATHADLSGSFLTGSNLSDAILSDSNLSSATLDEANLKGANLFGVRLNMVRLHGANLKYTGITPARLAEADMAVHADSDTIWGSEKDCAGRNPLQVFV